MAIHRKAWAALLTLLSAAAIFVTAGAVNAAPASATTCTDLVVIGARGSGDAYDGNEGMGKVAYAAYQQIKNRVPGAHPYGLPYEAVAVYPEAITQVGVKYWPSIALGVRFLSSYVDQVVGDCPNERIALIGYSQGAHVIADTLPQWGNDPRIRSKIAAVLLFGDPRFNPMSPIDRGTYSKSLKGIFPSFQIDDVRTVSSTWFGITRSYCELNDFICNYSAEGFRKCSDGSTCGHFSYVVNAIAPSAGAWAGNLIKALPPLVTAQPPAPTAPTAQPTSGASPTAYWYQVYHTCANGGCGLFLHSTPSLASGTRTRTLFDGSSIGIVCQARGPAVSGKDGTSSTVWDKTVEGDYVADFYVKTPGTLGNFSSPIPQC